MTTVAANNDDTSPVIQRLAAISKNSLPQCIARCIPDLTQALYGAQTCFHELSHHRSLQITVVGNRELCEEEEREFNRLGRLEVSMQEEMYPFERQLKGMKEMSKLLERCKQTVDDAVRGLAGQIQAFRMVKAKLFEMEAEGELSDDQRYSFKKLKETEILEGMEQKRREVAAVSTGIAKALRG